MSHSSQESHALSLEVEVSAQPRDRIRSTTNCPIANSIKESDDRFKRVAVSSRDEGFIAFSRTDTGMRYYYLLPQEARDFIDSWDSGVIPEDFMLKLDGSMLIREPYRTFLGIEDQVIEHESPRGPRTRSLPTA